jgi:hypothetical protein
MATYNYGDAFYNKDWSGVQSDVNKLASQGGSINFGSNEDATTSTNQTSGGFVAPGQAGITALSMSPAVANTPTAYTSPVSTPNITTKELPQLPYLAAQNQPGLAEAPPGTGPDMRMTGPEVEPQARTRSLSGAVAPEPATTATMPAPVEAGAVAPQQPGLASAPPGTGADMRMTGAENQPQAYTGGGLKIGGATQAQYAALNSGDNKQLMNLVYGLDTPPHIQQDAMDRLYNDVDTRRKVDRYKSEIEGKLASGDIVGLQKSQRQAEKADEGSYFKAILYGFVNPQLAAAEWQKISPVYKSVGVAVGDKQYHAYVNPMTGEITKAKDPTTNEFVDDKTLTQINAQFLGTGKAMKPEFGPIVEYKGTNPDLKGAGGRVVSYTKPNGKSETVVESGTKTYAYNTNDWASVREGEAQRRMDYGLVTDLKKKHGTNVLDALATYEEKKGPLSDEQRGQFVQLYGGLPATGIIAGAGGAGGAAGGGAGGAAGGGAGGGAGGAAGTEGANKNQITFEDFKKSIIRFESGGKHTDAQGRVIISKDGAVGIGQITPDTFRTYQNRGLIPKEWKIGDPKHNEEAAGIILDDLNNTYKGNFDQAAAAYFGGPGAVNKDGSINWNRKDGTGVSVLTYVNGVRADAGLPAITPTGAVAQGAGGGADLKKPLAQLKAESEATGAATKEEATGFVKYAQEDITPKAEAGSQVARIRKEQIKGPDGILNNPELAGMLQGQGTAFDEVRNIIRDMITGNYKNDNDLSSRVASLNLTQRQKDVLNTQIGLSTSLNPLTLKANAGPGAVSDPEQRANRQANVDITRQPLYSGLTLMTRSQYVNDLAAYRQDFKAQHPELKTTSQFNQAWSSEKARLDKQYDNIYATRAGYIAQYNKDGKTPGAVVDAYKHYPVPEYDAESKRWTLGGYSAKAARPKLTEFVR